MKRDESGELRLARPLFLLISTFCRSTAAPKIPRRLPCPGPRAGFCPTAAREGVRKLWVSTGEDDAAYGVAAIRGLGQLLSKPGFFLVYKQCLLLPLCCWVLFISFLIDLQYKEYNHPTMSYNNDYSGNNDEYSSTVCSSSHILIFVPSYL